MTKDKDFKDLVHARAAETGEKYTAARERMLEEGAEEGTPRRIFGLESRYVADVDFGEARTVSPDEANRHLFRRTALWDGAVNRYLANGSRLYLATEHVVEYATPESVTAREAVCHQRAGERRLTQIRESAQQSLRADGVKAHFELLPTRSRDGGCHENYSAMREFPVDQVTRVLVPFLVTRQVVTGGGGIAETSEGRRFVLSPRLRRLAQAVAGDEFTPRLVNVDASPHADPHRFRRIHIDGGDVSRSEATAVLKLAMTALVLRVVEDGSGALGDLTLDDPIEAVGRVGLDPTCKATIRLRSGEVMTAVDVQEAVLGAVRSHVSAAGATNEERRAVSQWQETLDGLRSDVSLLADSVEWIARLQRLSEEFGDLSLTEASHLDRSLDLTGYSEETFAAHQVFSEAEVDAALRLAPRSTRAFARGRFINACLKAGKSYTVDWSHLKLSDEANRTLILKDPFAADDPVVARYLDYVEGAT